MSAKLHSVGTIQIEPCSLDCVRVPCDDSTLELLLTSFAHRRTLADDHTPRRESTRLFDARWLNWPVTSEGDLSLRANLLQLIEELEAEFNCLEAARF